MLPEQITESPEDRDNGVGVIKFPKARDLSTLDPSIRAMYESVGIQRDRCIDKDMDLEAQLFQDSMKLMEETFTIPVEDSPDGTVLESPEDRDSDVEIYPKRVVKFSKARALSTLDPSIRFMYGFVVRQRDFCIERNMYFEAEMCQDGMELMEETFTIPVEDSPGGTVLESPEEKE